MLINIDIKDLATIESLHLSLTAGCTMITGETGAGKSVFLEAIDLALGGRASTNLIRPGKEKAEISLTFDVTHFPKVIDCLTSYDLHNDIPECIIRRVLTQDGRSRCYVNGSPSTLQLVKELGELLFHLHSQHDQQVLLKTETQREMLDRFADHLPLVYQVKQLAEAWRSIDQQIKLLKEKMTEKAARSDYLHYQLNELKEVDLKAGEWERLEIEHRKLTHAGELIQVLQQSVNYFSEDNQQTIFSILADLRKTLEVIRHMEPRAEAWLNTLASALISLTDLEADLQNYLTTVELDPEKLAEIEERVTNIFNLSRKHKVSPNELVLLTTQMADELTQLKDSDETLTRLEKEQQEIATKYELAANALSQSRQAALLALQTEMTQTIRSLSLPHGEFRIALESDATPFALNGKEKIQFLIKTNPDQSFNPLAKVISGGELSRLSLAAHLALANQTTIPTLIFDEVDTGLSGATAEKIGKLLQKLGKSYQVFCVTHQPQVAACGHQHLLVEKYFIDQTTHTRLRLLNIEERTREVARMLGGEKITEKTLAHAREVLQGS